MATRLAFRSRKSFSQFIIRLATAATALSVAVMIVTLGFLNGFQEAVSEKVFHFWGHVRIQQDLDSKTVLGEETPIPAHPGVEDLVRRQPGVRSVERFATRSAILKRGSSIENVILKGMDSSFQPGHRTSFLTSGTWPSLRDSGYGQEIAVSDYTARRLELRKGDSLWGFFFREDGGKSVRKLRISGTFRTGIDEYDRHYALGDIRLIRRLNGWGENDIGGYEVFLENAHEADSAATRLYPLLPQGWYSRSIRELFPHIFDWLGLQGQIRNILIVIMMFIAAVNLITCLIILQLERVRMTGILKALGAGQSVLRRIFLYYAAWISLGGLLLGNLLGLGLCWLQDATGLIRLDEEAYFLSEAQVSLSAAEVIGVNLATFLCCLITLTLPTLLVRRVSVVKSLRFR